MKRKTANTFNDLNKVIFEYFVDVNLYFTSFDNYYSYLNLHERNN